MAVSDFLERVGEGLEKGAKATGRVAAAIGPTLGKSIINEEAGYAPQIAAEQRASTQKAEDAQIAVKAQELETQLETGRKYGTLTPEQQQQYVDAITQLYSHPRHAPVLMEKLRKAVHPNGAVAGPPPKLADATPEGGTVGRDEELKAQNLRSMLELKETYGEELAAKKAEIAAKYHKPAGKSPPLPGNQLPPDAVGADGQPIGQEARDAAHSFVEWNGSWWPVAKAKPVFKTVRGHSVLMDAQSGNILRDLGPTGTARVTTRQTLQPGDDGQMHLVSLTSVSTPSGEKIEVDPEPGGESGGDSAPAPKSKPSVGGIIKPKTPAKAPGGAAPPTGSAGKVVPGLSTLARSKNPLYKADASSYKKANDDAIGKAELYKNAQGLLADNNRTTDLDLIFAWVRSNIQGAGRITNTEIQQAAKAGSYGTRIQSAIDQASTGRIAPELERQFLSDIKRSADTAQQTAADLKHQLDPNSTGVARPPDDSTITTTPDPEVDQIIQALKGKK